MIAPGTRIGLWTVKEVDESGRRALCECRCGNLRAVFIASLLDGSSVSCGCGMPMSEKRRDLKSWRSQA